MLVCPEQPMSQPLELEGRGVVWFSGNRAHYVVQAVLELVTFLIQLSKSWDCVCAHQRICFKPQGFARIIGKALVSFKCLCICNLLILCVAYQGALVCTMTGM